MGERFFEFCQLEYQKNKIYETGIVPLGWLPSDVLNMSILLEKLGISLEDNEELTKRLEEGSRLVRNQKLSEAINIFTEVIDLDPKWAEAWNKRATALYMIGDYKSSQKDIDKVLELEKRHFGALAGEGLVNIKLKNYEKAIKSYQKAQKIYPSMKSPNIMIEKIKELIKQQSI